MLQITYRTYPSYRAEPVNFCGCFRNEAHFEDWANNEMKRGCYRDRKFEIIEIKEMTEEEYNESLKRIRNIDTILFDIVE